MQLPLRWNVRRSCSMSRLRLNSASAGLTHSPRPDVARKIRSAEDDSVISNKGGIMSVTGNLISAAAAGAIKLGDLTVNRMGYGAMRITGTGIWGPPADRDAALATLRRAVELD